MDDLKDAVRAELVSVMEFFTMTAQGSQRLAYEAAQTSTDATPAMRFNDEANTFFRARAAMQKRINRLDAGDPLAIENRSVSEIEDSIPDVKPMRYSELIASLSVENVGKGAKHVDGETDLPRSDSDVPVDERADGRAVPPLTPQQAYEKGFTDGVSQTSQSIKTYLRRCRQWDAADLIDAAEKPKS